MSAHYQLLKELIDLLEQYETAHPDKDPQLLSFSMWLSQRLAYPNAIRMKPPQENGQAAISDDQAETALAMLISYLNRYAKHYVKKALEDSPLSTIDDFTFLATLSYQDSLTKSELIQMHLLEITSGIEIIKRLTRNGLLSSFADPNDRRSKRVKLTDKGKETLDEIMGQMDQVAHILSGDLNTQERNQLLPLLHKLNDFHTIIHQQDKKSSLGEIATKYLS